MDACEQAFIAPKTELSEDAEVIQDDFNLKNTSFFAADLKNADQSKEITLSQMERLLKMNDQSALKEEPAGLYSYVVDDSSIN